MKASSFCERGHQQTPRASLHWTGKDGQITGMTRESSATQECTRLVSSSLIDQIKHAICCKAINACALHHKSVDAPAGSPHARDLQHVHSQLALEQLRQLRLIVQQEPISQRHPLALRCGEHLQGRAQ